MSKARELSQRAGVDGALSNRNLIINGEFKVAQRGISETGVGAVVKYANAPDRVKYVSLNSAGTHVYTISQSTTAPDGFSHSYKLNCTTADTSLASNVAVFLSISAMEGQNLQHLAYGNSSAESVTLSFYVRSNKTGTYVAELYNPDAFKHIGKTYTINSANTWEKKIITFSGDTAASFNNDNDRSLEVILWLAAGSDYNSGSLPETWATLVYANRCAGQTVNLADATSNEIYITGVQLEVGDTATPFEHRSYGQELALCQRYYFQDVFYGQGTSAGVGKDFSYRIDCPVDLRASPTISTFGSVLYQTNVSTTIFQATPSSTGRRSIRAYLDSTTGAGNVIEYGINFQADAEL